MKIAIGIATTGRPKTLKKLIDFLGHQTRKPDAIYICPVNDDDVLEIDFDDTYLFRVDSGKGASKQRNSILKKLKGFDIVVFIDDDYVPDYNFVNYIEKEFKENTNTVIVSSNTIRDGVKTKGILFEDAVLEINQYKNQIFKREKVFSAYGSMSIRLKVVFDNAIFFDENLPLYSWLEDLDFTRRIVKKGESVKIFGAFGVHLGEKSGRTSGVKFGYSQVANPLYIAKKKNGFTYFMAIKMICKNILANSSKFFFSEKYVDRKGRLKGNLIALKDLVLGKISPLKIITFNH